mgnify:CR=1 FL=1
MGWEFYSTVGSTTISYSGYSYIMDRVITLLNDTRPDDLVQIGDDMFQVVPYNLCDEFAKLFSIALQRWTPINDQDNYYKEWLEDFTSLLKKIVKEKTMLHYC